MISPNASLEEFQSFNKRLYEIVDDRNYSNIDLLSYVLRHVTQILKMVRKNKYQNVEYHLCMTLSWSLAVANRLHLDAALEVWQRFPGVCPYCGNAPCACKERAPQRQKLQKKSRDLQPKSLQAWQAMFAGIYTNTTQESVMHLAEEVGELYENMRNYLATHKQDWLTKTVEELVDVIINLFCASNCLKFDLGAGSARYFAAGCPKCKELPCQCGYVPMDSPIVSPV